MEMMSMSEFGVSVGEGRLALISSLSRVWISGWVARRYDPHVSAEDVVSCLGRSVKFLVRMRWVVYPAARKVNS